MGQFLSQVGVLLKDFGDYAQEVSARLIEASLTEANRLERPVVYLPSASTRKEDVARKIAARGSITGGLVCVLKCVEPCMSFSVRSDHAEKMLKLDLRRRACSHLYHYWIDPEFGWMNARIQTWFPFPIQVCVNGREWLSRRLDGAGITYRRRENGFTWIDDPRKAQDIMDGMLRTNWPDFLTPIAKRLNPAHETIFKESPRDYYWSTHQSEWATDLIFKSRDALQSIYPALTRGAIACFSSPDVMRFLGKKLHGRFEGEVRSDYKRRPEGVRVKHGAAGNSVKVYDKFGSILRVETTINHPSEIKVFRKAEGDPESAMKWRPMRKGIADLHRRAEVSQKCNERYLDALASLDTSTPIGELAEPICRPTKFRGRRVRALHPWSKEDDMLLAAISRGEFTKSGFRNRDIVAVLFPGKKAERRLSSKVTRLLRMLRAHGLVLKIPGTHRYQITRKGRPIVTALIQSQRVSLKELNKVAD